MKGKFVEIRNNYSHSSLKRENLESSPLDQVRKWVDEALKVNHDEPTAMTLATVDATGQPTQRVVLLKDINDTGFSFFTNYFSRKGGHLAENPKIAANIFWPRLERQVSIEGRVEKLSENASDSYFASRPRDSQIGAWASPQSTIIDEKKTLDNRFHQYFKKFEGQSVPRPPHWGGFVILPHRIEFWQGRPSRLHDRFVYQIMSSGQWDIIQLAP